jgi:hypothetical protein
MSIPKIRCQTITRDREDVTTSSGDYEFVDASDFYPDDEELMDIDASVNIASGKYHE